MKNVVMIAVVFFLGLACSSCNKEANGVTEVNPLLRYMKANEGADCDAHRYYTLVEMRHVYAAYKDFVRVEGGDSLFFIETTNFTPGGSRRTLHLISHKTLQEIEASHHNDLKDMFVMRLRNLNIRQHCDDDKVLVRNIEDAFTWKDISHLPLK